MYKQVARLYRANHGQHNHPEKTLSSQNKEYEHLLAKIETMQYEQATLSGLQGGFAMLPEPFTVLQQKQCKFDGHLETDRMTQRELVPVVPSRQKANGLVGQKAKPPERNSIMRSFQSDDHQTLQDSIGTIVDIAFAEELPATLPAEFLLKKRPKALYVKLDDVDMEFLMPKPCQEHLAFNPACKICIAFPGIIQVVPKTQTWSYELPKKLVHCRLE